MGEGGVREGWVMSSHAIFIPDHFLTSTHQSTNEYAHAETREKDMYTMSYMTLRDGPWRPSGARGGCGTERQEAGQSGRLPGSCLQGRWAEVRWAVGRWAAGRLGRRRQPHQRVVTLAVSRVVFEFTCQPIPIRSLQV